MICPNCKEELHDRATFCHHCASFIGEKKVVPDVLPKYGYKTIIRIQAVIEEYIDGLTVSEIMEVERYTPKTVKKVILPILEALAVIHEKRVIHRDIKPGNIIVSNEGRVVLIDFNASRQVKNAPRDTVVLGTVGFAAPETGTAETDERADIYGVGVLMNVMLTGNLPTAVMAKGKYGRIIKKCTMLNPNDRYDSVAALKKALT